MNNEQLTIDQQVWLAAYLKVFTDESVSIEAERVCAETALKAFRERFPKAEPAVPDQPKRDGEDGPFNAFPESKHKPTCPYVLGFGRCDCGLVCQEINSPPIVAGDNLPRNEAGELIVGKQPTQLDSAAILLELAWVVIANANGGDWIGERPDWRKAASEWRDDYHLWLANQRNNMVKAPMSDRERELLNFCRSWFRNIWSEECHRGNAHSSQSIELRRIVKAYDDVKPEQQETK